VQEPDALAVAAADFQRFEVHVGHGGAHQHRRLDFECPGPLEVGARTVQQLRPQAQRWQGGRGGQSSAAGRSFGAGKRLPEAQRRAGAKLPGKARRPVAEQHHHGRAHVEATEFGAAREWRAKAGVDGLHYRAAASKAD